MNRQDIENRLARELSRLGLPANQSLGIAERLSQKLSDTITDFQKGVNMRSVLMGSVAISNVQKRISIAYPKYSPGDYGIYSVVSNIIKNHPDWTEDQVYAEAEKSVKPASAGGLLVIPKPLQDIRNNRMILVGVAVGAVLLLSVFGSKLQKVG